MAFQINKLEINGLAVLYPQIFTDERGFFMETFRLSDFNQLETGIDFVQDNLSKSCKGTVRGIHFQAPPAAQAKLVTVMQGRVLDVVVDIRKGSPTYGKTASIELNTDTRHLFFIPTGFAHGFSVLSDECLFYYKCSHYYSKAHEMGIRWNDPDLAIDWKVSDAIISPKDKDLPLFKDFVSPFEK